VSVLIIWERLGQCASTARLCAYRHARRPRRRTVRARAGDKASGCVRALYSPTFSERGVLLCAGRKLRAKDPFDFQARSTGGSRAVARRCMALQGAAVWCTQSAQHIFCSPTCALQRPQPVPMRHVKGQQAIVQLCAPAVWLRCGCTVGTRAADMRMQCTCLLASPSGAHVLQSPSFI